MLTSKEIINKCQVYGLDSLFYSCPSRTSRFHLFEMKKEKKKIPFEMSDNIELKSFGKK